jgi:hypothetical protein
MNKQALSAFLNGQITPEAASLFKNAVAVDGALDIKNKVKSEKDVALQLESIEKNIGGGNVRVATANEGNAPVPMDAITALLSGKKGALAEAKAKTHELAPKFDNFKKEVSKSIEGPVYNKVVNEQKVNASMGDNEIKEYIKETVYDYIIHEGLSEKRLEKIVNKIIKDNIKTYLKEALIELKNTKK